MARVEIPFVVNKVSVSIPSTPTTANFAVSGASVAVNIRGGSPATIYAAETGGTTLGNPLTSTAEGRIDGWLDEGSYTLTISGAGITTYMQPIEVVRGDGVSRIAAGAIGTAQLAAASVTAAKLAPDVANAIRFTGEIAIHAGANLPAGWLWCDGKTYDGTTPTYLPLWNEIGAAYGGTQAAFKVPDLRGRAPVGADALGTNGAANRLTSNNARGSVGGVQSVTLSAAQSGSPAHSHSASQASHSHTPVSGYPITDTANPDNPFYAPPASPGTIGAAAFKATSLNSVAPAVTVNNSSSVAASSSHDNMPPYQGVGYIIKI